MRHFLLITLCLVCAISCKKQPQADVSEIVSKEASMKVEVFDFAALEPLLQADENRTRIINFWATWCKPCLEELPYFEEINDSLGGSEVEVILVSLDFPKKLETQLIPYVEKHGLKSKVILLDDPRENIWIPKVDSTWSGALPATLIINKDKRKFYEMSFDRSTLKSELTTFLNTAS